MCNEGWKRFTSFIIVGYLWEAGKTYGTIAYQIADVPWKYDDSLLSV